MSVVFPINTDCASLRDLVIKKSTRSAVRALFSHLSMESLVDNDGDEKGRLLYNILTFIFKQAHNFPPGFVKPDFCQNNMEGPTDLSRWTVRNKFDQLLSRVNSVSENTAWGDYYVFAQKEPAPGAGVGLFLYSWRLPTSRWPNGLVTFCEEEMLSIRAAWDANPELFEGSVLDDELVRFCRETGAIESREYLKYREHPLGLDRDKISLEDFGKNRLAIPEEWVKLTEKMRSNLFLGYFVVADVAQGKSGYIAVLLKSLLDNHRPAVVIDSKIILAEDSVESFSNAVRHLSTNIVTIVIEDIHLIPERFNIALMNALESRQIRFIATCRQDQFDILKHGLRIEEKKHLSIEPLPDKTEEIAVKLYENNVCEGGEIDPDIRGTVVEAFSEVFRRDLALFNLATKDIEKGSVPSLENLDMYLKEYFSAIRSGLDSKTRYSYVEELICGYCLSWDDGVSTPIDFFDQEELFRWGVKGAFEESRDYVIERTGEFRKKGERIYFERHSSVALKIAKMENLRKKLYDKIVHIDNGLYNELELVEWQEIEVAFYAARIYYDIKNGRKISSYTDRLLGQFHSPISSVTHKLYGLAHLKATDYLLNYYPERVEDAIENMIRALMFFVMGYCLGDLVMQSIINIGAILRYGVDEKGVIDKKKEKEIVTEVAERFLISLLMMDVAAEANAIIEFAGITDDKEINELYHQVKRKHLKLRSQDAYDADRLLKKKYGKAYRTDISEYTFKIGYDKQQAKDYRENVVSVPWMRDEVNESEVKREMGRISEERGNERISKHIKGPILEIMATKQGIESLLPGLVKTIEAGYKNMEESYIIFVKIMKKNEDKSNKKKKGNYRELP